MFPPISRIRNTRPLLCLALLALLSQAPVRGAAPVILETEDAEAGAAVAATAQPPAKPRAARKPAAKGAQPARALESGPAPAPTPVPGVERVQFQRRPVNVVLEIGRERLVHFPFDVALHQPEQADGRLAIDNIGSTVYLTANAPMERVRLVAEGIDGQGMIPLDLLVRANAPGVPDEMEIRLGASAPAERDQAGRRGRRSRRPARSGRSHPPLRAGALRAAAPGAGAGRHAPGRCAAGAGGEPVPRRRGHDDADRRLARRRAARHGRALDQPRQPAGGTRHGSVARPMDRRHARALAPAAPRRRSRYHGGLPDSPSSLSRPCGRRSHRCRYSNKTG